MTAKSGRDGGLPAAGRLLCVARLVLHDPPYSPDDPAAREWVRPLAVLLERGQHAEAIAEFYRGVGMPEEVVEQVTASPQLVALAPTLAYDSAVMDGLATGGAVPADLARRVSRPALVLVGTESPPFMIEVGRQLAELLPAGSLQVLAGQDHVPDPEALTPVVTRFLNEGRG